MNSNVKFLKILEFKKVSKQYCLFLDLFLELKEICASSSRDLNITLMYAMFRAFDNISKPKNGWGRMPCENALGIADDIERIRFYRNFICHTNANEMKTGTFNDYVLDLIGVNMINILDIATHTHTFSLTQ